MRNGPIAREFNLAKIIVGAEGTLGTVTEAVLYAVPLPRQRGVACLQFRTIDAALKSVTTILETEPSAIEMLDKYIVELSRNNLEYRHYLDFVEGTPEALLIVEYSGDTWSSFRINLGSWSKSSLVGMGWKIHARRRSSSNGTGFGIAARRVRRCY